MNKHKFTLAVLLAVLSLTACNGSCNERRGDIAANQNGQSTSLEEIDEGSSSITEEVSESSMSSGTISIKPSQGISEAAAEISLEDDADGSNNTIPAESLGDDAHNSSIELTGNGGVKPIAEASTKYQDTAAKPVQAATQAQKPTQTSKPIQTSQTATQAPVWHEPVYNTVQVYVIDKEAWTEEVVTEVQVPVYEKIYYTECTCGFKVKETNNDLSTTEWVKHESAHLLNGEAYAYRLISEKELTGYTTEYQITYIEHDEEGHWEERQILVSEGYWE